MQSSTTKEMKSSNVEYRFRTSSGGERSRSSAYSTTYSLTPGSISYATDTGYDSVGGFFGPGARPERLTAEKRSLSGSSLSAAVSIRDSREREKKEISDLNDRLASYIEKVRFLDAQNRKMTSDLELLRARMGKDTFSTKMMFEGEIAEARKLIKSTDEERVELEKQIPKLEADLAELRKKYETELRNHRTDRGKIDDLIVKLVGIENESNLLRRRVAELENEVVDLKKINMTDSNMLSRTRTDVDQEGLSRLDLQNRLQMLLENIDAITHEQEQELSDLQALAVRDTTSENREYFKNELASAIRSVRSEYDQVMAGYRSDIDSWYQVKVREIYTSSNRKNIEQSYTKEGVKRLRTQINDIRARLADFEGRNSLLEKQIVDLNLQLESEQKNYSLTLKDRDEMIQRTRDDYDGLNVTIQNLLETKQTLEAEIIQYRKLLEGEESRAGLRRLAETVTTRSAEFDETSGGGGASKSISISGGGAGGGASISMSGGGGGVSSSYSSSTVYSGMSSSGGARTSSAVVSGAVSSSAASDRLTKEMGETTSKIKFEATASGNVSIKDAALDGKFITLENTSMTVEEDISKWQLKRTVDNGESVVFTFPDKFTLRPLKTVKIWAKCAEAVNSPPDQLVFDRVDSFGTGLNATTVLINTKGEERASSTQKTTLTTVIYG